MEAKLKPARHKTVQNRSLSMPTRRKFLKTVGINAAGLTLWQQSLPALPAKPEKLNILWILAEDASPHLGCYGETAIKTPNLDALAASGIRFDNAFVTCPVCSPSRSAMVTGMYQTTIGAHQHRSQRTEGKGSGNRDYYDSYRLPDSVPLISDLFRQAGYYTCNGAGPAAKKPGKTDYNFVSPAAPYDGTDWRACPEGKPFFAQIQLAGGKSRRASIASDDFALPPYYPDDPVLRRDWSNYLASWLRQDAEVGQILTDLRQAGVLEHTAIFYLTDHGVSHMRGKQFLYDEGIHVPLIVRLPDRQLAGTVRQDLVAHIDLAVTSLALAGIAVPEHLQGRDLFGAPGQAPEFVVSARDRCDETIDIIRSVRTERFKYIRNFISYRSHAQDNQYKDGKEIVQTMRRLHAEGRLDELQDRVFQPSRPVEELYDLRDDPDETRNLALDDGYQEQLGQLRATLYDWMVASGDLGLCPEPILEDLGREYGNKYSVLKHPGNANLVRELIAVIETGEKHDTAALRNLLDADHAAVRYWAATWSGILADKKAVLPLQKLAGDAVSAVRVAAKLALCKLGHCDTYLQQLCDEIDAANVITGMYAMNAIEQTGILNQTVRQAADRAMQSKYEFILRYGRRLRSKFDA
jgi:arylsulfatase A-like enzyme